MEIQDHAHSEIRDEVRHEVRDEVRHEIKSWTLAHMVDVVSSTPVHQEPFPHFIAHGILPPAVYEEMLALLPEQSLYEPFEAGKPGWSNPGKAIVKRVKGQGRSWSRTRGQFQLSNASIDRLKGRQQSFWLGVRDALGAPELKVAVYNRLRDALLLRFEACEDVKELPGYPHPKLFRETSGYKIKPHPDAANKVVTMQIALAADGTQENLGTQFYRRSSNPRHLFGEPLGFEVSKQVPFLPNVAYAFVVFNARSPKTWHGRTTLKGETGVRNTILQTWYAKASRGNPDIVGQ